MAQRISIEDLLNEGETQTLPSSSPQNTAPVKEQTQIPPSPSSVQTVQTTKSASPVTTGTPTQRITGIPVSPVPAQTSMTVNPPAVPGMETAGPAVTVRPVQEAVPKITFLIYGHKGHGKTAFSLSFPGRKLVLCFDRKASLIKKYVFGNSNDIVIYDITREVDSTEPTAYLDASEKAFNDLVALLRSIQPNEYDYIIIDGSEIFQNICEMVMRKRNNLMPFQGVANRNVWKERRMYIQYVHQLALSKAKRGIIYTTYVVYEDIIENGEVVARKEVPKWIDAILYETDVVINVKLTYADGVPRFYATVITSKLPMLFPIGLQRDVTGAFLRGLVPPEAWIELGGTPEVIK